MTALDIDPYEGLQPHRGLCIVHAIYDSDFSSDKSESKALPGVEEIDDAKDTDFFHDWYNYNPDKARILRGSGYIKTIRDKQYIVTCNHIMVSYATYVGYCYDDKLKIVKFNMKIYHRIPELDLVIMEPITKLENKLFDLPLKDYSLKDIYEMDSKNVLITGETIPGSESIFNIIELNTDINIVFDILKSKYIQDIPLLNIPVYEMEMIKKVASEYKIDLKTDMKEMNTRRNAISRIIAETLSGTSGSIIRSNNINIGMCCMYTDTDRGISLKALPLFLIDIIISNAILLGQTQLSGVHIDTHSCDIEYMKEKKFAHYVIKQSCNYINGKKSFTFNEGDIILEVDDKQFNKNGLLLCDIVGIHVPLNTYLMIRSNLNKIPISIKIAKQHNTDFKIIKYNMTSILYDNMFNMKINPDIYIKWNKLVFFEMTEEIIMFYKKLGINIINNERNVILFNYKKRIFRSTELIENKTSYYKSMPYMNKYGHYFYQVKTIGSKKITCIDDIIQILSNIKHDKKITFKLSNPSDDIEVFKV
jgi:hypothetical protein